MRNGAIRWLLAAVLVLLCLGCGGNEDVRTLTAWTVVAPSGARRQVTLPARFEPDELDARSHVVLESVASIPDAWRGKPLTLALAAFLGSAELRANAKDMPAHAVVMAHAWSLDGVGPEAPEIALRLDLDARMMSYVSLPPRLSPTPEGDATFRLARDFNFLSSVVAGSLIAFLALLYATLFGLDRRRRENGWVALQAVAALPTALSYAGVLEWLIPWSNVVVLATSCISVFAAAGFERSYFRRARLHRAWLASLPLVALIATVPRTLAGRWLAVETLGVLLLASASYVFAQLVRDYWTGRDRFAAATVLVAYLLLYASSVPDLYWLFGHRELAAGFRGVAIGNAFFGLCLAVVLGRDHIRSLRQAEERVREVDAGRREVTLLNEELRRQIAERSRQLAEALGRVGEVSLLATSFTVGEVLKGRYRVVRPLGEGGMGTVYEVVRLSDERRLALKVLTQATTGEAMARLAREAQVAAKVSSEHLVSILDVDFTEAGALYLVMELVDGGSLESLRSRFGDVPWALAVLRQVATGLRVLHDDGVVHRDLKPGNVLVAEQNGAGKSSPHVKIADFGLARITADREPELAAEPAKMTPAEVDATLQALTRTGALMGTPMYMAPELARGAREATPSSDIWAFGVLAYEMLSGKPPFLVPPVREALWQRKWPAPPALDAKVRAAVVTLVERSLDARPESRPTATDWLAALTG